MNESTTKSNESSLENPSHVVTMTSPIVTTTIQDSINPSQDVVASENDYSTLPPYLSSNVPKRKKQIVSPEDFDFKQLALVKHKTTKKTKNLSRIKVDKNKNKYVQVAIPLSYVVIGQVQDSNYVIHKIEPGKQTHDSVAQDAHLALEHLVSSYKEDKAKKDQLKAQIKQLTSILIKIIKSLEAVEPITSSLDEEVVKRAEQATSYNRVVGEWIDQMLSQGTQLISLACAIVNKLDAVRTEVDNTIEIFSQELETQEKYLKLG